MIMQTSTETAHLDGGNSSSSMSSFMSGLLKERAIQFSLPNSNWSIQIVDDNARAQHIDKRKMKLMQQSKSESCRDLRWGGGTGDSSGDNMNSPSSSADETSSLNAVMDSRGSPGATLRRSSSHKSVLRRNINSSSKRGGRNHHNMDFKKHADGNSRFTSTGSSASDSLPSVPSLRRSAASDTMLLKMPVRTKSPGGGVKARPSVGAVARANATWGAAQQETASSSSRNSAPEVLMGLSSKLPQIADLSMDDSMTAATTPLGDDWFTSTTSQTSSPLSRMSSSSNNNNGRGMMMSRSSNSIHSSLSMSSGASGLSMSSASGNISSNKLMDIKERSRSKNNDKSMKKKKKKKSGSRSRSNSSDSLKKRASLLGLDIK
mmetsp:Transcript_15958/g.39115  ORF Transcript_15958/g.39115 Transcript_15958/m.39115 type:complete len:376 (+) Transcript_15958:224-1351(+)